MASSDGYHDNNFIRGSNVRVAYSDMAGTVMDMAPWNNPGFRLAARMQYLKVQDATQRCVICWKIFCGYFELAMMP